MEWIRRVEVTRFKAQDSRDKVQGTRHKGQGARHTLSAEARLYDVSGQA